MDSRTQDRQAGIYGTDAPALVEPVAAARAAVAGSHRPRLSVWQIVIAAAGAIGTLSSVAFGGWAMFGHLVLPEAYTFPAVMGARQGFTTGAAWKAGADGQINAQNRIARGTAQADGQRQATVIKETTSAQAAQTAEIQTETIAATAILQASANCYAQLLSQAQMAKAHCIGTGVAGAECQARADLIIDQLPACGSLDANPAPDALHPQSKEPDDGNH